MEIVGGGSRAVGPSVAPLVAGLVGLGALVCASYDATKPLPSMSSISIVYALLLVVLWRARSQGGLRLGIGAAIGWALSLAAYAIVFSIHGKVHAGLFLATAGRGALGVFALVAVAIAAGRVGSYRWAFSFAVVLVASLLPGVEHATLLSDLWPAHLGREPFLPHSVLALVIVVSAAVIVAMGFAFERLARGWVGSSRAAILLVAMLTFGLEPAVAEQGYDPITTVGLLGLFFAALTAVQAEDRARFRPRLTVLAAMLPVARLVGQVALGALHFEVVIVNALGLFSICALLFALARLSAALRIGPGVFVLGILLAGDWLSSFAVDAVGHGVDAGAALLMAAVLWMLERPASQVDWLASQSARIQARLAEVLRAPWSRNLALVCCLITIAVAFTRREARTPMQRSATYQIFSKVRVSTKLRAALPNLEGRRAALRDRFLLLPTRDPIQVEVLDRLPAADAGAIARAGHVLLRVGTTDGNPEFALAHETAHLVMDEASRGALRRWPEGALFFEEGLATYLELPDEARRLQLRTQASRACPREPGLSATPWRTRAVVARCGRTPLYKWGFVFVEALVERHGEAAPRDIVRALRADGFRSRNARDRWVEVFARAGCDFDGVLRDYERRLWRVRP